MSKISELTRMDRATIDRANDLLAIVDSSAGTTKAITPLELIYPGDSVNDHDIKSLCTSDYNIASCTVRSILGCSLCIGSALINNPGTGIPYTGTGTMKSLIELPSSIFVYAMPLETYLCANEAGSGPCSNSVPIFSYTGTTAYKNNLVFSQQYSSNFIAPPANALTNGNIKAIRINFLAVRLSTAELP